MDLDNFTAVLTETGADLWGLIDAAISLAARDHGSELRARRDGIVERLYLATATAAPRQEEGVRSGGEERENNGRVVEKESAGAREWKGRVSPSTPESMQGDEEDEEEEMEHEQEHEQEHEHEQDIEADEVDQETKILAMKGELEVPDQDDDTYINLLQNLTDMEIDFHTLRHTDIGRVVHHLRKHSCPEVRGLVKLLVAKWKDVIADFVKSNAKPNGNVPIAAIIGGRDSPQRNPSKSNHNGYQASDYGFSSTTNHQDETPSSEKNTREPESSRQKAPSASRRESPAPSRPSNSMGYAPSVQSTSREQQQKDSLMDPERLASARRRLQENYQEINNGIYA